MKKCITCSLLAGGLLAGNAMAADLINWQGNSLTYLYGKDFAVDPSIQNTITFEHASDWSIGDLFLFVDKTFYNGKDSSTSGDNTYYGEFSPRLSFNKIFGQDLSVGPVSDVLLAMTREFGEGDVDTFLIGPGFDLQIPGFNYAQLNFYYRNPQGSRDGEGVQVTPTWSFTVPAGRSNILVDGFIDWIVDNDNGYHSNLHFNPQIKYDLGKAVNWEGQKLYIGVEYSYWKDKYGIENSTGFDSNDNVTSFLLKYNL
ncbi:outer membrane protein OmpK [Phytohalomonas tamaricis]|uniref:outer membrane protein OmpK n=1 Tax=Phytohalomonas tamaricis TaxID=2081032 RepID=UPI000D0B480E|nr:outer membrane protein OmpK [Phytohalomonas tamaricis]